MALIDWTDLDSIEDGVYGFLEEAEKWIEEIVDIIHQDAIEELKNIWSTFIEEFYNGYSPTKYKRKNDLWNISSDDIFYYNGDEILHYAATDNIDEWSWAELQHFKDLLRYQSKHGATGDDRAIVLDFILNGIRFPGFMNFAFNYSGENFAASGTPYQIFSEYYSQFDGILYYYYKQELNDVISKYEYTDEIFKKGRR